MAARRRNIILSFIVRTIVCIVLLVIGIGVFSALVKTRPEPARSDVATRAPQVIVFTARLVSVARQWDGYGTVEAVDSADVPARVTATVSTIPDGVVAGAEVNAGQVLVQLDDSDFLRQVEIAQQAITDIDAQLQRIAIERKSWTDRFEIATEQVELARAEFDRVKDVFDREVANQRELDNARQALLTAIRDETAVREEMDKVVPRTLGLQAQRAGQESQLRLARQNVERCRITSPIDGFLQDVYVEVGENLTGGARVARVVDTSNVEIALRLPASARATVRRGDTVVLHASGRDDLRSVPVTRIAPEDDAFTRTTPVYVEVRQDPAAADALAPGQFLRANVRSSSTRLRGVVPRRSVGQERVMLVIDGVITSRPIEVDYHLEGRLPDMDLPDEQWVVLQQPLPTDAQVVLNGSRPLPDGLRVEPVIAVAGTVADRGGSAEAAP